MTRPRPAPAVVALLLATAVAGCAGADSEGAPPAGGGTPATTAPGTRSSAEAPVVATTGIPAPEAGAPVVTDPPHPTEVGPLGGEIPELPAVAVGAVVDAGGGLTAEVVDLEGAEIVGGVPGDVAGPAVAVTVAVTNTGSAPADIEFVVVSAAYGEGQEAPGYDGDPADPLLGPVPAGETREGTYVFGVPDLGTGTLVVRVGTDPARPLAVFTADASVWGDR